MARAARHPGRERPWRKIFRSPVTGASISSLSWRHSSGLEPCLSEKIRRNPLPSPTCRQRFSAVVDISSCELLAARTSRSARRHGRDAPTDRRPDANGRAELLGDLDLGRSGRLRARSARRRGAASSGGRASGCGVSGKPLQPFPHAHRPLREHCDRERGVDSDRGRNDRAVEDEQAGVNGGQPGRLSSPRRRRDRGRRRRPHSRSRPSDTRPADEPSASVRAGHRTRPPARSTTGAIPGSATPARRLWWSGDSRNSFARRA